MAIRNNEGTPILLDDTATLAAQIAPYHTVEIACFRRRKMLWTIFVVLLVLWLVGLIGFHIVAWYIRSGSNCFTCCNGREFLMNSDQVSGKFDQIGGKIKQGIGETIGNQDLANEGVVDQVKGSAKEVWGNAKDAVHQNAEERKLAAEEKANEARGNLVDGVDAAKDHANTVIDGRRPL
jgi:uncharacterized protein YjbJ (UPF0337 family)